MIEFRRARPSESDEIRNEAALQKGCIIAPTHVFHKNGQLAGALSVGAIVTVQGWLKQELKIRDSQRVLQFAEEEAKRHGPVMGLVIEDESPLNVYLPRYGFIPFGKAQLFVKPL